MIRLLALLVLAPLPAYAQTSDITVQPIDPPFDFEDQNSDTSTFGQTPSTGEPLFPSPRAGPTFDFDVESRSQTIRVRRADGAVLKGLDKVTGEVVELAMANGDTQRLGRIEVRMGECRQPVDNPTGDAFAWVEVQTDGRDAPDFTGWMIASSPALSALDHARYDVWVMRCTNNDASGNATD